MIGKKQDVVEEYIEHKELLTKQFLDKATNNDNIMFSLRLGEFNKMLDIIRIQHEALLKACKESQGYEPDLQCVFKAVEDSNHIAKEI